MPRDDASALTDEDSSYGPVPPPPSNPPPEPEAIAAAYDRGAAYDQEAAYGVADDEEVHIENMPTKDDPPQEYPDGTPLREEDYEEDMSVEIPPTQVVQRMIKEEQHQLEKDDSNIMFIGGAIACCLIVIAVVLGAGFGTGAFTKDDVEETRTIPDPDATLAPVATAPTATTPAPAPVEPPVDSPVDPPTESPVEGVPGREPAAFESLVAATSFNPSAFEDNTSPEAKALAWIVSDDPLQLDPEIPSDQFRIRQRYALLSQRFASPGGWTDETGWFDGDDDECNWFGVSCEEQDVGGEVGVQNVVVSFDMEANGFAAVTPDIAMLTRTTTLNFANNPLTGQGFPQSIVNMTELKLLYLDDCGMTGDLSELDWSAWTQLEILSFAGNSFSGSIGESFYSMTSLKEVYFNDGNQFTGQLSPLLANLVDLEIFDANSNAFTGQLPEEFSQLQLLRVLDLAGTPGKAGFFGVIPDAYGNFASLQELSLESNGLTGEINPALSGLSLTMLRIGNNNYVQGPIPDWIYSMTTLEELGLEDCRLDGIIDPLIGNLVNLKILALEANFLTGDIPAEIGSLTNLELLTLNQNRFDLGLPAEITNLVNLAVLDASECDLTGELPQDIDRMESLVELRLSRNSLTGQIPEAITDIISLEEIYLDNNALTGPLPFPMGSLFNLRVFRVHDNTNDDFAGSGISGMIPPSLGNLRFLEDVRIYENLMTGSLPTTLGGMASLRYLDIETNGFTGIVPQELSNCLELETFLLAFNDFDAGDLPEGLCAIDGIEIISDCNLQNSCSTCRTVA